MEEYYPIVVQVDPKETYHVEVYFDDGKVVDYDVTADIKSGGVFDKLKDINFFKNRCTVMNGTLAWDTTGNRDETKCIDIDPFTLYELDPIKPSIA